MNLQNWISQARQHWKEHLPKLYQELQKTGKLEEALKAAAEQTYLEVNQLEESGLSPDEAWQMVRETYLFRPEEGSEPEPKSSMRHEMAAAAKAGQRTMPAR